MDDKLAGDCFITVIRPMLLHQEENVIVKALVTLHAVVCRATLQRNVVVYFANKAAVLLCHPNTWIRQAAATLVSQCAQELRLADVCTHLAPAVRPFVDRDLLDFTLPNLLNHLRPALTRPIFTQAIEFAKKQAVHVAQSQVSGQADQFVGESEETAALQRLTDLGMSVEDETKLVAMWKYIYNVAETRLKDPPVQRTDDLPEDIVTEIVIQQVDVVTRSTGELCMHCDKFRWKHDVTAESLPDTHVTPPSPQTFASYFAKKVSSSAASSLTSSKSAKRSKVVARSLVSGVWHPEGISVAHLTAHTSAVRHIAHSPDGLFFVTGSDDGSLRVWDCHRLHKNVTMRPRLVFEQSGGPITSLTFLNGTRKLAVGVRDGNILILEVYVTSTSPETTRTKYERIVEVCSFFLPEDYATCMVHENFGKNINVSSCNSH